MASITNSRTLFFVTSPRSPNKMINEIRLLRNEFSGGQWNSSTQTKYAQKLSNAPFYDGKALNTDFSARDRINRAPKALGLVDLKPIISITEAGSLFIESSRPHEVFTRQLLKFQLPSPYHTDKSDRFYVKPFLELLRLINDLEYLTKDELAIFGLQLIDFRDYDLIKDKIISYRNIREVAKNQKKSLTELTKLIFWKECELIYNAELSQQKYKIRETREANLSKFLKTKKTNAKDYSDAAIRYLRQSELIIYERRCIHIAKNRKEDVEFILQNVPREPVYIDSERNYKTYLFNASLPALLIDDREKIISEIEAVQPKGEINLSDAELEILKDIREKCIVDNRMQILDGIVADLETYDKFGEIMKIFEDIMVRNRDTGLIERPLLLEWNIWRAMAMLDDGEILGNFSIDDVGLPLHHAPGGKPDIHCKYRDFQLIVEVTLSTGHKQYEMEGEPVARHLGDVKNECGIETYCLFIAPEVNPSTIAHFYLIAQTNVSRYGGKSKIIPISIDTFKQMITKAYKSNTKPTAKMIRDFLQDAYCLVESCNDENQWYTSVKSLAENWLS